MKRISNFLCVLLVATGLVGVESIEAFANDLKSPNVLFIAVDDLNDWVGYLGGHPQGYTPNIDKLANEGVAFTHAYCPAPVCGPSRTALMYGIFPHRSGSYGHDEIYSAVNRIPKDQLPLNLVFQNSGYYTAGCGKIFHYPEKRGWDEYKRQIGGVAAKTKDNLGKGIQLGFGILDTDNDSDTGDGRLTDWAIEQLQRRHEKPFFIALGLHKPHLPWDAPKKYFDRLDLETIKLPRVPQDDLADLPEAGRLFARAKVGFSRLDDHQAITEVDGAWEKLVRAYLATSTFADANVGRVLDALQASDYSANTIVVLWGDHGWHLGEKQHWRKMSLWERGTRTPLIIKVPQATGNGRRINAPVSLQDIFPTLIDLCKVEVDQEIDGNSLKPLLLSPQTEWDKPVVISHGPGNFAVRKGAWRLIHYADGSEELYNIEADPGEFSNLVGNPEHQAQRLELQEHVPTDWRYVIGKRFNNFGSSFAKPKQ